MTFGFSLAKSELRVKIMVAPCTWNGLPRSSPLGHQSRDLKLSASFSARVFVQMEILFVKLQPSLEFMC